MTVFPILPERAVIEGSRIVAGPRLVTSHVYPPIPVRSFDWCAFRDGQEEAGGYGWGATEAAAIADLLETEDAR